MVLSSWAPDLIRCLRILALSSRLPSLYGLLDQTIINDTDREIIEVIMICTINLVQDAQPSHIFVESPRVR